MVSYYIQMISATQKRPQKHGPHPLFGGGLDGTDGVSVGAVVLGYVVRVLRGAQPHRIIIIVWIRNGRPKITI